MTRRHPAGDAGRSARGRERTGTGIGIGSTAAAVRKAYPKTHGSAKSGLFIIGSGKPKTEATVFSLDKGKVAQISIGVRRAG